MLDQLKYELFLKAVAWDFKQQCFVSPSRSEFTWSKDGLVAGECPHGCPPGVVQTECVCGIWSTYDWKYVLSYTRRSTLSVVMLCETSGEGLIYPDGKTARSAQLTVKAVINSPKIGRTRFYRPAAYQAADYFSVPVIEETTALTILDLWMAILHHDWREWYTPQSDVLNNIDEEKLSEYREQYVYKENK